jgi:hypothetical protein
VAVASMILVGSACLVGVAFLTALAEDDPKVSCL